MNFRLVLGTTFLAAAVFGACGGDDDEEPTPTADAGAATSPTSVPTPRLLPTVPPRAASDPALSIASGDATGTSIMPTVEEFRAYPTETINGKTGVTLAALAAAIEADAPNFVTIEGRTADGRRFGATRYPFADVAATTILVMDDKGHISMESSTIKKEELLDQVQGVAFTK